MVLQHISVLISVDKRKYHWTECSHVHRSSSIISKLNIFCKLQLVPSWATDTLTFHKCGKINCLKFCRIDSQFSMCWCTFEAICLLMCKRQRQKELVPPQPHEPQEINCFVGTPRIPYCRRRAFLFLSIQNCHLSTFFKAEVRSSPLGQIIDPEGILKAPHTILAYLFTKENPHIQRQTLAWHPSLSGYQFFGRVTFHVWDQKRTSREREGEIWLASDSALISPILSSEDAWKFVTCSYLGRIATFVFGYPVWAQMVCGFWFGVCAFLLLLRNVFQCTWHFQYHTMKQQSSSRAKPCTSETQLASWTFFCLGNQLQHSLLGNCEHSLKLCGGFGKGARRRERLSIGGKIEEILPSTRGTGKTNCGIMIEFHSTLVDTHLKYIQLPPHSIESSLFFTAFPGWFLFVLTKDKEGKKNGWDRKICCKCFSVRKLQWITVAPNDVALSCKK